MAVKKTVRPTGKRSTPTIKKRETLIVDNESLSREAIEKYKQYLTAERNKKEKTIEHHKFFDILSYLKEGDVLVRNNSKVIPARLFGVKEVTNAKVEVLLLKDLGNSIYECLCGNAKVIKVGTVICFGDGELKAECLEIKDEGIRIMKLIYQGILFEILDK